jgi:predicted NBD/HSP70 family sugar kinase
VRVGARDPVSTSSPFPSGPDSGAAGTRRLNRLRLFEAIRREGPISRADLAKRTQLSPPTVSALVEELASSGLLHEIGVGVSSGGRPPILLEFNGDYGSVIGVDLGSKTVRFGLADLRGHVLVRQDAPTDARSRSATLDQVLAGIAAIMDSSGRDPRRLFGIGIGAPGSVDVATGRVIEAATLADWRDVPLRDLAEARFGVPVRIDNDASLAALGERWRGVARLAEHFVFLALGVRVGAGLVIDGKLHRGHQGRAGDVAAALPAWPPSTPDEAAAWIGTAVANVIGVVDPELVVLGGGWSRGGAALLDPVRSIVSRMLPQAPPIELSALGDNAALLGAIQAAVACAEPRLLALVGGARAQPRAESA